MCFQISNYSTAEGKLHDWRHLLEAFKLFPTQYLQPQRGRRVNMDAEETI